MGIQVRGGNKRHEPWVQNRLEPSVQTPNPPTAPLCPTSTPALKAWGLSSEFQSSFQMAFHVEDQMQKS